MAEKNDGIGGEIILTGGEQEAKLPAIPMPVLEALFATVTGAKDTIKTLRRRASKVQIGDIEQLEYLLSQWVAPYDPVSSRTDYFVVNTANDDLKGHSRAKYGSLEALKRHEVGRTDSISSLTVVFSTLVENSEAGRLDNLEMSLTLSGVTPQYLYDAKESDRLGFSNSSRPDDEDKTLTIDVKYTNYVMAKGLISVVDDWYQNLDEMSTWIPSKNLKFIYAEEAYDQFGPMWIFLKIFPLLASAAVLFGASKHVPSDWLSNATYLTGGFLFSLLLYATIDASFRTIIRRTTRLLGRQFVPLLLISAGDQKREKVYLDAIKKKDGVESTVLKSILLAFGVSVLAGIIANTF